jgi:hypothetical protein
MKLTPTRIKFLTFMSGTYGRWVRAALGVSLGIVAIMEMGWSLLLLIPAAFMIYTAIINYCPATLAFPSFKPEQTLKNKYPLFKSR